jgi:two-component system sensor histidine kinase TctE
MPSSGPQLRRQLLVWLLVPLFVLLAVDSFVSYQVALEFSRRAYDRSLLETARELSLHLRGAEGRIVLDLPPEASRILLEDPEDRIHYSVTTLSGERVLGEALPPAPQGPPGSDREVFHDAAVAGEPVRVVELALPAAGARPEAVVRVAETTRKRRSLAQEILLAVVWPQALLLAVAGLVVWVGVARGLAPLERLRRAVAARSHREWTPVGVEDVPGEVRPLLQEIDELVAKLDQALTLQERFIGDAAHQLKTPITVLKANLELALRGGEATQVRQSLEAALAGLERMSRIVTQLLSLARNEPEGSAHLVLQPTDLAAVAFESAMAWVPAALKRRIDLGFDGPSSGVSIRGEPERLRELFDNLIDNAVRYSAEGGRVTVRVEDGPPVVHVNDDGPRIPAGERQRVFERFHRLLGEVQGGSGLGLAIAREIARIHGATITLREDPDGIGNTFSVSFPAM